MNSISVPFSGSIIIYVVLNKTFYSSFVVGYTVRSRHKETDLKKLQPDA